jgi:hypothetical protein
MLNPDRRHIEHIALDQLDPIVLGQYTGGDHHLVAVGAHAANCRAPILAPHRL